MTGVILLTVFTLVAWAHWLRWLRRSGFTRPQTRREMEDCLPMPGGIYHADWTIHAFVLVVFFVIDPVLRDNGVSPDVLTLMTIWTLVIVMGAIHASLSMGKKYLLALDALRTERQRVAVLIRS